MTVSQRILEIMEQKHIKQKTLADYTGISTSAISDWKKKGTNPSVDKIVAISECLGVSIDYLLGKTQEIAPPKELIIQSNEKEELLELINSLSLVDRSKVIVFIDELINKKFS